MRADATRLICVALGFDMDWTHETPQLTEIPTQWFNALPFLPVPLPSPIEPEDGGASRLALMDRIRLPGLKAHDQSTAPYVDIPGDVLSAYRAIGRPTPLTRARSLERALQTTAKIYLKREDCLPTGSFKLNSAIAQAHLACTNRIEHLVTESGAGQWAHALAYACNMFGCKCSVFWVRVSMAQKQYRRALVELLGAKVHASPSRLTASGRALLEKDPSCPGSLGTSIGDAIQYVSDHPESRYVSGSNHLHVLLHQTVIGLETKAQLRALGEAPTHLVACCGGGSNLAGFMTPFLPEKTANPDSLRLLAAESNAAPRLTSGQYRYDHADPGGLTPLTKSYTLGSDYMPPANHVGGLRQHSGSPVIGVLRHAGLLEARAYAELEAFRAGELLVSTERILPAPESCHAICGIIDLVEEARHSRSSPTIVACVSGSGLLDLCCYSSVLHPDAPSAVGVEPLPSGGRRARGVAAAASSSFTRDT
jgi:tryptophan synthase beta chain